MMLSRLIKHLMGLNLFFFRDKYFKLEYIFHCLQYSSFRAIKCAIEFQCLKIQPEPFLPIPISVCKAKTAKWALPEHSRLWKGLTQNYNRKS